MEIFFKIPGQLKDKLHLFRIPGVFQDFSRSVQTLFKVFIRNSCQPDEFLPTWFRTRITNSGADYS